MRKIGYARVSTDDQNLDLQLDALKASGAERIFTDKISGRIRKRDGLDKALTALNTGDVLVVWKLDRLGRSFRDLVTLADVIQSKGAHLISITDGIDTSSSVGLVVFRLMSVFADFERSLIAERTRAGLRARKDRGQRLGRKPKLTPEQSLEVKALLNAGLPVKTLAYRYGVGRATIFRAKART